MGTSTADMVSSTFNLVGQMITDGFPYFYMILGACCIALVGKLLYNAFNQAGKKVLK